MSVEIAWKQNILVTDFHLLKSLLVVFGFGSQAFVCGFSRQNINSVVSPSEDVKFSNVRGLYLRKYGILKLLSVGKQIVHACVSSSKCKQEIWVLEKPG